MRFEWDERKNEANQRKHGFDFADAELMFKNTIVIKPDTSEDYGEERWLAIGSINGRISLVVFTYRREVVRIISLRKANHEERKEYEETIKN